MSELKAVPTEQEQPIAGEALKALYPELLEVQLEDARLKLAAAKVQEQARRVAGMQYELNAKLAALAPGEDLSKWRVDLKTGQMVKA